MKSVPDPDTTPDEKMQSFQTGLRHVLGVSKAKLDRALDREKKRNEGKPKRGPRPSASGHASGDKD